MSGFKEGKEMLKHHNYRYTDFECDCCHRVFHKVSDDWVRKHVSMIKDKEADRQSGTYTVRVDWAICEDCLNKLQEFFLWAPKTAKKQNNCPHCHQDYKMMKYQKFNYCPFCGRKLNKDKKFANKRHKK